ncbi:MAG TPA: hypothetical protein VLS48_05210 [Anaerolineales bacterium]|nr:hypothetical protein [Anaerolineales bacterium]
MNTSGIQGQNTQLFLRRFKLQRGLAFGVIIVAALLAFEMFNYSSTEFALSDLLGELSFLGVRWSTILALAFCGIDFAGIARLFTPEDGREEAGEVWYLFGAWLLAATMNAMLTWWGVSIAVLNHETLGNAVIERGLLLRVVPIFVAVLVWLIRVLIIGTFSVAGDRLFSQADYPVVVAGRARMPAPARRSAPASPSLPAPSASFSRSLGGSRAAAPVEASNSVRSTSSTTPPPRSKFKPAPKQPASANETGGPFSRPEPTYEPLAASSADDGMNTAEGNIPGNRPNPGGASAYQRSLKM